MSHTSQPIPIPSGYAQSEGNQTPVPSNRYSGAGTQPAPKSSPQPAPIVSFDPAPSLQQIQEPVEPGLYRATKPNDTVNNIAAVLGQDSLAPATDTSAIAQEPPQEDKGFQFPDGEPSLIAEAGLFNSVAENGIELNPQSILIGGGIRYTVNAFSRHKIAGDFGVNMNILNINQEQNKQKPMFSEAHGKERIFMMKSRFMITDHFLITRNVEAKFDAIEIGLFSEINFFTTHVAVDYHGNDNTAALTRSKTRMFGLHYLRNIQFGTTVRIANDKFSVFGNYRLNKLVKGNPNGGDLPALVIGIEMKFAE